MEAWYPGGFYVFKKILYLWSLHALVDFASICDTASVVGWLMCLEFVSKGCNPVPGMCVYQRDVWSIHSCT